MALWLLERGAFNRSDYIQLIGVKPDARGRGVGRALMEFAEARSESRDVFLFVSDFNTDAHARQFLSGQLKPSATNRTKQFNTSYPYTQPPKAHYNPFTTDALPNNLGAVIDNFINPPFTYYDVNEGKYIPFFAESWTIR